MTDRMNSFFSNILNSFESHFQLKHGPQLWLYMFGALAFIVIFIVGLMMVPKKFRKYLIWVSTFIGGLYYSLEFFLPLSKMKIGDNPAAMGNFITPTIVPIGNILGVVAVFTYGLGVINLVQLHGKRIRKGGEGALNSTAFFASFAIMLVVQILQQVHPNPVNKNLFALLYEGAYQNMDATMFSVIAFYIVSAAYRAFRARSFEASLLLVTAVLVMIGQTAVGQLMTSGISDVGFWHNLHIEVVRDWIMTKANTPVMRAIQFGLGIGALAVALRIWLGLERGSYFDNKA